MTSALIGMHLHNENHVFMMIRTRLAFGTHQAAITTSPSSWKAVVKLAQHVKRSRRWLTGRLLNIICIYAVSR